MAKKIKATHRLRRPHEVLFDPTCHFLKKADAPAKGARVVLPKGTHIIPSPSQLANMPDRLESLSTPEAPATAMVDDDEGEDEDEDPEPEAEAEEEEAEDEPEASDSSEADDAVDAALEAVSGEWDALLISQLTDLADAYDLSVEGTGSGGNVLKADLVRAVQGARRAAA